MLMKCLSKKPVFLTAILTVCLLTQTGCANSRNAHKFDGLWLTDGYSQLIDIKGDTLSRYELSTVSCIFSINAFRMNNPGGNYVRFVGKGNTGDTGSQDAFRFTAGNNPSESWMLVEGAPLRSSTLNASVRPPCFTFCPDASRN